jgi:hypothetical protein
MVWVSHLDRTDLHLHTSAGERPLLHAVIDGSQSRTIARPGKHTAKCRVE